MELRHPLYFIRHGETDWNRARRVQGQTDIPLNDTGREQARRIAARLPQVLPDISGYSFLVSPLARARQTMAPIQRAYNVRDRDLFVEPELREQSFGAFEGKTWADIEEAGIMPDADPEGYFNWQPPQGESYVQLTQRIRNWLSGLDRPAVVVAHGAVSRVLRGIVFELPKREIVQLKVSQNKFYRIQDGGLDWFDARQVEA